MTKSYYDVLAVPRTASEEEIRTGYRKMAFTHHPDRGGDAEMMKLINESYKVLSDGEARASYDKLLDATNHPRATPEPPTRPNYGNCPPSPWGDTRRPAPTPAEETNSFGETIVGAAFVSLMVFNFWLIEVASGYLRISVPLLLGVFGAAGAAMVEGYMLILVFVTIGSWFNRSK